MSFLLKFLSTIKLYSVSHFILSHSPPACSSRPIDKTFLCVKNMENGSSKMLFFCNSIFILCDTCSMSGMKIFVSGFVAVCSLSFTHFSPKKKEKNVCSSRVYHVKNVCVVVKTESTSTQQKLGGKESIFNVLY